MGVHKCTFNHNKQREAIFHISDHKSFRHNDLVSSGFFLRWAIALLTLRGLMLRIQLMFDLYNRPFGFQCELWCIKYGGQLLSIRHLKQQPVLTPFHIVHHVWTWFLGSRGFESARDTLRI